MRTVNNLAKLIKAKQEQVKAEKNIDISEVQIAVAMGINPATLSHYKNSKVESVNWEVWHKLAAYFGVPGHEIFDVLPDEEA
jgi:hypothetical protein